tara:strand:- start:146 stop:376 length:231 start_codon:yes stop_codon:yes gene_type:complete
MDTGTEGPANLETFLNLKPGTHDKELTCQECGSEEWIIVNKDHAVLLYCIECNNGIEWVKSDDGQWVCTGPMQEHS